MYVMVCTIPNISYAVVVVSFFLDNLGKEHLKASGSYAIYKAQQRSVYVLAMGNLS